MAPEDPTPHRCIKVTFDSRADAKRACDKTKRNYKLRPYHCCYCGYWHLTSMTNVQLRANRKKKRERLKKLKNKKPRRRRLRKNKKHKPA